MIFHFSYGALIRMATTICASGGLKVSSRVGHHIELLNKLSIILNDKDIKRFGNEMRKKRNLDIYGTGIILGSKELGDYMDIIGKAFMEAEEYFDNKKGKNKML